MDSFATPLSTQKYFQWMEIHPQKRRLLDGLTVSALGCGSYLGSSDDAGDRLYERALFKAGSLGVNFFDTAINYRCMRSEKILGRVIKELSRHGILRDQLVIATKGGYIPCEGSPDQFEEYVRIHYLDTGLMSAEEMVGGCHCMSPDFLEQQIHSSLSHLGLDTLDLYYLHNPETQLLEVEEVEFYKRLTRAFALFEKKVREKKIMRYGIATWNGFRQKAGSKTLQLARILACAEEVGGKEHHFRAVQMPYNLVMLEAIKMKNQIPASGGDKKTMAEFLKEQRIALIISAPLMQSQITHLPAHVFERLPEEASASLQALQFVLSTPSVVAAMVGMKSLDHVDENLKLLQLPNWRLEEFTKACSSLGL